MLEHFSRKISSQPVNSMNVLNEYRAISHRGKSKPFVSHADYGMVQLFATIGLDFQHSLSPRPANINLQFVLFPVACRAVRRPSVLRGFRLGTQNRTRFFDPVADETEKDRAVNIGAKTNRVAN